ncbi:unnamed protein product [Gadus morhua 'NCC']
MRPLEAPGSKRHSEKWSVSGLDVCLGGGRTCRLLRLYGFCSPRAAKLAAREPPGDVRPPTRFHNQENKQGSRGTTHYGDLRVGWIQGAGKVQRSQERKLRGPPIR